MSTTTKSPRKVAAAAYRFVVDTLPEHSSRFSPKKYTQAQLFVCLVLKTFFNTDYRGIVEILNDSPELCKDFALKIVPHFTTLHKASKRLLRYKNVKRLLENTCKRAMQNRKTVEIAAMDATGLQSGHISPYFFKRRSKGKKEHLNSKLTKFPKMAIIADTSNHMILTVITERGHGSDSGHFEKILRRLPKGIPIDCLTADAGYDGEANHVLANETFGIETIIPPNVGRKTDKPPKTKYRRKMKENFDRKRYGQRWQVETVYSMIKRNLTDTLLSRSFWAQCHEICLLAITHNLMIIQLVKELFYRAKIPKKVLRTCPHSIIVSISYITLFRITPIGLTCRKASAKTVIYGTDTSEYRKEPPEQRTAEDMRQLRLGVRDKIDSPRREKATGNYTYVSKYNNTYSPRLVAYV